VIPAAEVTDAHRHHRALSSLTDAEAREPSPRPGGRVGTCWPISRTPGARWPTWWSARSAWKRPGAACSRAGAKSGSTPSTWPGGFCEHAVDFLEERLPDDAIVTRPPRALAAWLSGKDSGDGLTGELPELGPWPGGRPRRSGDAR
jgi:hypothetical protein